MQLDRRSFTAGLVAAAGVAPGARAADPTGLFWTAAAPSGPACVLFGYARTAAAVTQDIVKDGDRYAGDTQRLVADIPNMRFPTVSIPRDKLLPILDRVSALTAKRLRGVLDQSFAALPMKEKVTGIEMVLMLRGEGQTPPEPSVGGTIAEHAQAAGKPISSLVTSGEMMAAFHPPDLVALDQRVNEQMLFYLLGLREIVGPLGKFEEGLYIRRRSLDLASADADMARHNVPGVKDMLPTTSMEPVLIDRAVRAVQSTKDSAFFMLPVASLTRTGGVLAKMREAGVQVVRLG